jgi:hypothetical protein
VLVLHATALPGNPYDGHTFGATIAATEQLTGCEIERAYADNGYRGHNAENPRRVFYEFPETAEDDIHKDCHQAKPWHCFDQDVLSFTVSLEYEDTDARRISLWLRQRFHEAGPEQIASDRNNRDGFCRLLKGANCTIPSSCDDIDPYTEQFGRILRNQIDV